MLLLQFFNQKICPSAPHSPPDVASVWGIKNQRRKRMKTKQKKIAQKFFEENPRACDGVWCFFEMTAKPKSIDGIFYDGIWYGVTYQSGSGFDFSVRKQNQKFVVEA
jgi:hypothetical protein